MMIESTYIQRLKAPIGEWDPLSFGCGGLKGLAFPENWRDIIVEAWAFDLMGNGAFEFGAVPESLEKISDYVLKEDITTKKIEIPYKYVNVWGDHSTLTGKGIVYIICRKSHLDEVTERIKRYARSQTPRTCKTAERVMLSGSMAKDEVESMYIGWLELNNGYMFFTDKEMFENSCKLFGVT